MSGPNVITINPAQVSVIFKKKTKKKEKKENASIVRKAGDPQSNSWDAGTVFDYKAKGGLASLEILVGVPASATCVRRILLNQRLTSSEYELIIIVTLACRQHE